jgi:hypothetical protein
VNLVSAQLKRLEDAGVVEKAPWFGEKKAAFQIAERFFNIWYLMRASRRVRQKLLWLVKFLEAWFDREKLGDPPADITLAQLLTLAGRWSEAVPLLDQLAAGETQSTGLFQAVVKTGHVSEALAILERAGADQRCRPLYEALRAVEAGSPDYLRRVAPEVRTVAMEMLREIAPDLR